MEIQESLRQKRLIKNFLENYSKYYDYFELCYLKDLEMHPSYKEIPDILRQILCELNLLKDEDNAYLEFANLIEKVHGLDKNIIDKDIKESDNVQFESDKFQSIEIDVNVARLVRKYQKKD